MEIGGFVFGSRKDAQALVDSVGVSVSTACPNVVTFFIRSLDKSLSSAESINVLATAHKVEKSPKALKAKVGRNRSLLQNPLLGHVFSVK